MNKKTISRRPIFVGFTYLLVLFAVTATNGPSCLAQKKSQPKTINFPSADGLEITADLYLVSKDKKTPMIVLCHQAGWSRGEYQEIAPKLNKMGYNCLAIDQRSGGQVNGVKNQTLAKAKADDKKTGFVDAEQDIVSALKYARKNYAEKELVLWGSSYSAALSLVVAGKHPKLCDRVLSFAPGEYFGRFGKSNTWVQENAKNIKVPVFITSAKNEFPRWEKIYRSIPGKKNQKFVPTTKGNHGSRALWNRFNDSKDYWKAVKTFLKK